MREYQKERRWKIREGLRDMLTRRVDEIERRVEVLENKGEGDEEKDEGRGSGV